MNPRKEGFMRPLPFGNGSGKHDIDVFELAPDWVFLYPREREPFPPDLPMGLGRVLLKWFKDQENVRIRTTLPIIKDGNLIAVHVWFDRL
jgi:hypothetical protein